MKNNFSAFLIFMFLVASVSGLCFSADNLGVAISAIVKGNSIQNGDIVSLRNGDYEISSTANDTKVYGIVVDDALVSISVPVQDLGANQRLVMSSGEGYVRASNMSGEIKRGDFVTSSGIPGVGVKLTNNGYAVGMALEDLSNDKVDENGVGKVLIILKPGPIYLNTSARFNLLEAIKSGSLAPLLTPVESLRYVLAAMIVGATFIIGFSSFSKISVNSIQALGRNPLARSSISAAVLFNFVLAFGTMVIGLALGYLILVL